MRLRHITAACLAVLTCIAFINAATYTGTVTDSVSSAALESVTVRLQGGAAMALTDAAGSFILETVGILDLAGALPGRSPFRYDISSGRIYWQDLSGVSLTLYDMRGRQVAGARPGHATGSFVLPNRLRDGMYILEAAASGKSYRIKILRTAGTVSPGIDGAGQARPKSADGTDTLTFSKAGYVYKKAAGGTGLAVVLSPLGQAATGSQTSVTWRDVTFTFDKAMPVGYFCNGDPFVVSDQAFGITSISPDAEVINGYMANGSMMNISSASLQGFDGIPADNSASGQSAAVMPYVDSLNVDPAAMGHALSFAAGGSGSVVKSVRVDGVIEPGPWQVIDRYVILTVLPSVPPVGAFRPPVSGEDKSILGTETDLHWQVLRQGPDFAGQQPPDSVIGLLRPTLPLWGQSGEALRRINVEGGNNYSRDYGMRRATALLALHGTATQAEKRDLFVRAVQHGLDVYGAVREGWTGSAGAGQHHGYHPFLWYAAYALGSDDMVTAAQELRSNTVTQHFWVDASDIGRNVRWPDYNQHYTLHQTHFEEHLGIPDWTTDMSDDTRTWDLTRHNSRQTCSYKFVALAAFYPELTSVIILQNGPDGKTGDEAVIQGPFDSTNYYAAPLAYLDRTTAWEPLYGTNSIHDNHRAAYETFRDLLPTPRWTGRPDLVRSEWDALTLTATDGGFDYVYPMDISTLPVTRTDLRYSVDHKSWITLTDVPLSGSVTGLDPGVTHIIQMRQVNAAGAGAWSMNYPKAWDVSSLGSVEHTKATVTPTGSAVAGAPVNTTAPVLCYQKYPRWGGIYFEPIDGLIPDNRFQIHCGVGYWTGAPSYAYQWLRNGTPIDSATTDSYTFTRDDIGASVSCRVNATNGTGGSTAVSDAAVFEYDDQLDSNVIFESDFTNDLKAGVTDFIASCIASEVPADNKGMTVSWQPYAQYSGCPTMGVVYGAKNGGWPAFAGLIPVPAWATGKTVRFRAHYDAVSRWSSNPLGFRVYRATATERLTSYAEVSVTETVPVDADGYNFDETFTLDSDYLVLQLTISTATGGTSGGSPYLSSLKIETVD